MQLVQNVPGPSESFSKVGLGILEQEGGRHVPTCQGIVPQRICEFIEAEQAVGGTTLLAQFSRPPYGYTANVIKACVAGLLLAEKIKIQPQSGPEITAISRLGHPRRF